MPDVVVAGSDDGVDRGLVLPEHGARVVVGVGVRGPVQENELVIVRDQIEPDGELGLGDAVDAVDGGVHRREHAGDGASMELTVLPGAGQGEHVVPAGLAVGRADALGNAPIIESESAIHVSALAEAHGAHVASFAALARAGHEFRAGVHHQLFGIRRVPRVEIDRAAFRVHDAVEALIAEVNAAEEEGVPFGLNQVTRDGRVPSGEVRMEDVRADHAEGHRLPAR